MIKLHIPPCCWVWLISVYSVTMQTVPHLVFIAANGCLYSHGYFIAWFFGKWCKTIICEPPRCTIGVIIELHASESLLVSSLGSVIIVRQFFFSGPNCNICAKCDLIRPVICKYRRMKIFALVLGPLYTWSCKCIQYHAGYKIYCWQWWCTVV